MHISRHKIASALFALSALGPLGIWYVLLFHAIPQSQTPLGHAASLTAYVFTQSEAPWFFVVLTLAPLLLLALSASYWRERPVSIGRQASLKWLALVATVLCVVVCWPVAITSAQATYYVFREAGA